MKETPSSICRLPWTGFSNDPDGRIRACCIYKEHIKDDAGNDFYVQNSSVKEIFNSQYMKKLRQEFRENKKPAGCSTCWLNEENGVFSKRQFYLNDVENSFNVVFDWEQEPTGPSEFQMIISNSCNLKCRSCSTSHSTTWQAEMKNRNLPDLFQMPFKQSGDENGKLWSDRSEWYKNIRRLEIVGGEPFLAKQWHQIFRELIDQKYSKNIVIAMSSNTTHVFPELIDMVCRNFINLGIGLSVDGHGKLFEYLRHPGKWETVFENLKTYSMLLDRHSNLHLQFNITISWINAWYMPEFYEIINREFPKIRKWNNVIHFPEHMALWAIPQPFKDAIAKKWDAYNFGEYAQDFKGLKEYMYSNSISDGQFQLNIKNLRETDTFRNESIVQMLPEIAGFLNLK